MAKLTADQYADKHNRRMKASIEDIRSGVDRVTEAPGVAAARKQDKMLQNLTAKVQDGTWSRRVSSVPLEDWKDKMVNKGLNRIAGGVDAARGKVVAFAEQLLPAVSAAQTKVKAMPDLTLEDSINRMTTFVREMSKFKKK
ncbi:MAG: hypothetical protein GWN93_20805 [Deltaproteobacteria bacterium]|nr:hypothetical protein [Deltaproteobacteria bacterium]